MAMNFDALAAVAKHGATFTVHNVRLIDAQPAEGDHHRLTIEYEGTMHEIVAGGTWNAQFSRREVGRFGYVVPALPIGHDLPASAFHFRPYADDTLRRVPELDSSSQDSGNDGRAQEVIGWRCDARPNGFRAPVGIIPGDRGRYVPDETVAVTLRIPPEFTREAQRFQMTPEALLRSFVGDAVGIQNFVACPRADGYSSNGSDERDYAEAWIQRAHGMDAIDLDAQEASLIQAEEINDQRDEFSAFLDDFESYGGNPQDLFAAVQVLVDKQAKASSDKNS